MRRRSVPALVSLFLVFGGTGAAPPAAASVRWIRPVAGRMVRPFQPPQRRYGRGHLGVDFAVAPNTIVRAVGGGTVLFAGTVAGARHVVIRHRNGMRTSYSFLATIAVRRGATVERAAVVGTTGGRGEHHDGNVLHLALRVGETFVDPMQLFGPVDRSAEVHLAEVPGRPPGRSPARQPASARASSEARALLAAVADPPARIVIGSGGGRLGTTPGPVPVCNHRAATRRTIASGAPFAPG